MSVKISIILTIAMLTTSAQAVRQGISPESNNRLSSTPKQSRTEIFRKEVLELIKKRLTCHI